MSDTRLHWRGLIGDYRAHVTYAVSLSAVVNLLYLAPTIFMMQVYDRVVPTGGILTLIVLTLILAVTLAVLSALEWVRGRTLQQLSLRLDRTLGRTLADRQLQGNAPIRDGVPMMREFDSLRNVVAGPGIVALLDLPWTPIYCLVAFLIHPALGSFVLVSGILLVGIAILNQRHVHRATLSAHQATSLAYANHEMTLRRAEIVRALGMRDGLVTRHRSERETGLAATAELQRISAAYGAAVKFTRLFLQSAALAVGAMLAVEQQISVGSIIAASVLLSRALQPVEQLVAAWPGLVQARATLSRMGDLFARTDGDRIRTALPDPQGRLELRQVSVRDGKEGLLLNGVSASIPPGEITCVIGPSGAGKTTLAKSPPAHCRSTPVRSPSTARDWRIGIRTGLRAVSATCRKTTICLPAPSPRTSPALRSSPAKIAQSSTRRWSRPRVRPMSTTSSCGCPRGMTRPSTPRARTCRPGRCSV